jgi:NAD(P)-dependent dehydrogenase (short-subunit alcohol dehydrogenase family)
MQDFQGRTAVVTGAASGIGLGTATRFAEEGMRVVLADIEADALARAEQDLSAAGHEVLAVQTDVSSWDSVSELAARSVERFGPVHVLHNNAGVIVSGAIGDLSFTDWEWVLGVNLWGAIHGVKAFLPILRGQSEGHIVNTASVRGLTASPASGPYNVSKFGVVALTETLYRELAAEGSPIGCSVFCPGPVATRIVDAARNRPGELAPAHELTPEEENFQKYARDLIAKGIPPTAAGQLVVDAIRAKRFWIFTHPEWKQVLRKRVDALARDDSLASELDFFDS